MYQIMNDTIGNCRGEQIICKFKIVIAEIELVPIIEEIVAATIKEIYPKYYSEEVVAFFWNYITQKVLKKMFWRKNLCCL